MGGVNGMGHISARLEYFDIAPESTKAGTSERGKNIFDAIHGRLLNIISTLRTKLRFRRLLLNAV